MESAAAISKERVWATQRRHDVEAALLDQCAQAREEFDVVAGGGGEEGEDGERKMSKDLFELSCLCTLARLDLSCLAAGFQSLEPYKSELRAECEATAHEVVEQCDALPATHVVRLHLMLLWSCIGSPERKHASMLELLEHAEANEAKARTKESVRQTLASPAAGVSAVAEVAAWPVPHSATLQHMDDLRRRVVELAVVEEERRQREAEEAERAELEAAELEPPAAEAEAAEESEEEGA